MQKEGQATPAKEVEKEAKQEETNTPPVQSNESTEVIEVIRKLSDKVDSLSEELKQYKTRALTEEENKKYEKIETVALAPSKSEIIDQVYNNLSNTLNKYKHPERFHTFTRGEGIVYILKKQGFSNSEIIDYIENWRYK